jgi:hypothetical protein
MPAMIGLGRSRLALGRELRLLSADTDVVWLESVMRLRPGQSVELIGAWPLGSGQTRARVVNWRIIRLCAEGPIYRGCLRFER